MGSLLETFLILAIAIASPLAYYAWRRQAVPGSLSFFWFMAAVAGWALTSWLSYDVPSLPQKLFWTQVSYLAILSIPVSFAILVFEHKNQIRVPNKKWLIYLGIEPLLVTFIIWTNPYHHLFWKQVQLISSEWGYGLDFINGPVFWLNAVYGNLLLLVSGIYLLIYFNRAQKFSIQKMAAITAGLCIPWAYNLIDSFQLSPIPILNLTPVLLAFTSPIIAWGLFRFRLSDIIPVAYDQVIKGLPDGIIVLDDEQRILALNPAAERIIGIPLAQAIGFQGEKVLPDWPEIWGKFPEQQEAHLSIQRVQKGESKYFDIEISASQSKFYSVKDSLIILRDVTQQHLTEQNHIRRAETLSALHATLLDITASHQLPDILKTITVRAAHLLSASGSSLYLADDTNQVVHCVVSFNSPYDQVGDTYHYNQRAAGIVAQTGKPLGYRQGRTWLGPDHFQITSRPVTSLLAVPMPWQNQVTGVVIVVDDTGKRDFQEGDVELLTMLANQASIVVENTHLLQSEREQREQAASLARENARLYTIERQRAEELDALWATTIDISAELELNKLLQSILKRSVALLKASGGELGLFEKNESALTIVTSYQMDVDTMGLKMNLGEGVMGKVAETCRSLIVNDYGRWEGRLRHYPTDSWKSCIGVPMQIGGRLIGVIGLVDKDKDRSFSQSEQQLLALFSQQAAIAVDNAQLYHLARGEADRWAVLHRASQEVVAASLDPEGIYAAIHNAASHLMPTEAFAITLNDESNQLIQAVYIVDHMGRSPIVSFPAGRGISGHVIQTGKSLYIEDMLDKIDQIDSIRIGDKEEVRSILAVPMWLGGKVTGMLSSQSYQPHAYTPDDQHSLEMLASYAAIALDNTRLFLEVQKLAITDSLTGIYNRRQLFDLGQREFNRSIRFNRPLSTIMIDIDHFKVVNDTYGHPVGDQVLRLLAKMTQALIREIDILGRYGGEEYVIVLPETDCEAAYRVAERLRKQIENGPLVTDQGEVRISISLGVAERIAGMADFNALIARADSAMYDAKHAGRNQVGVR